MELVVPVNVPHSVSTLTWKQVCSQSLMHVSLDAILKYAHIHTAGVTIELSATQEGFAFVQLLRCETVTLHHILSRAVSYYGYSLIKYYYPNKKCNLHGTRPLFWQ